MKKTLKLLPFMVLIALCSCNHGGHVENIANGVWKVTYGQPDKFNLSSALEITPKLDVINDMPPADSLPFSIDELKLEVLTERHISGSLWRRTKSCSALV